MLEMGVAVFQQLGTIKRLHPALRQLKAKEMMGAGAAAPLHQGATRYFREKGMM